MRGGGPAYLRSLFAEDQGCDLARRQVCNMLAIDSVKHVTDLERCLALRRTAGNKAADYVAIARRDLERDSHAAQSCLRWVLRAAHRVLPCGRSLVSATGAAGQQTGRAAQAITSSSVANLSLAAASEKHPFLAPSYVIE
jgi:hypothetical protein